MRFPNLMPRADLTYKHLQSVCFTTFLLHLLSGVFVVRETRRNYSLKKEFLDNWSQSLLGSLNLIRELFGLELQSNLKITVLYMAVTLCITVTEQLPKNCHLYLQLRSPVYNGGGHPTDFLNPQFHYLYLYITVTKFGYH